MCIYVYICVYMCINVYICVYICTNVCMYIYIYSHTPVFVSTFVSVSISQLYRLFIYCAPKSSNKFMSLNQNSANLCIFNDFNEHPFLMKFRCFLWHMFCMFFLINILWSQISTCFFIFSNTLFCECFVTAFDSWVRHSSKSVFRKASLHMPGVKVKVKVNPCVHI